MDWKNLFFMGLPAIVIPFPMFHIQAQYILAVIEGKVKLPSSNQMREEYDKEKRMLLDQGIAVSIFLFTTHFNFNQQFRLS